VADGLKPVPNPQTIADLTALLPEPGKDGYAFFENADRHPIEKTIDFRQGNAWWMMDLSYLAYATDPQYAMDQLRAAGLDAAAFGAGNPEPPHVIVAHTGEVVIVAFRGTRIEQLADIIADLSFFPQLTSEGLVHRGFLNALFAGGVWEQTQRHIAGIPGNQVILFTGHSLGAALATLARRRYRDPRSRPLALYTFGSPRVGDGVFFCPSYPANSYRIVNDEDVIAHVPTPPVYGHAGAPLGTGGQPLPAADWEELEHRFAGAAATLGVFNLASRQQRLRQYFEAQAVKPLGDHAPRAYATKIWNSLLETPPPL